MWKLIGAAVAMMGAVGLLARTEVRPVTPPAGDAALVSPFPEGNDFDGLAARIGSLPSKSAPAGLAERTAR